MKKAEPHVVQTITTKEGIPVHICDNFMQGISTAALERRREEVRKAAWQIIRHNAVQEDKFK